MTSALLIGHSFIRRTRDFLIVPLPGKKGRDISESRQQVASIAADKAELAEMVSGLFTASQNINLVCDLWKAESTVVAIRPEIVLLHVGSNDLAHIVQDDVSAVAAIATSVVDFAKRLLDHFGVRFVFINSMVPRNSNNMSCSADVFLKNMTHFNRKVRHLSEAVQGQATTTCVVSIDTKYKTKTRHSPSLVGVMMGFTVSQHIKKIPPAFEVWHLIGRHQTGLSPTLPSESRICVID